MDTTGKGAAHRSVRGWAGRLVAMLALGGLVACGGGGESALELGSEAPGNGATGSGVVAVGAPVADAQIEITCTGGAPIVVAADADGGFEFPADRQVLPCVLRASGGTVNGATQALTLHSVLYTFGNVNITPLTDLLVARLGAQDPASFYAGFRADGHSSRISADTVAAASAELRQYLDALGVDTAALEDFDLVTGHFEPVAGDALDDVLENYAARLGANALTQDGARAAVASFTLPGPCSDASGFCWPVTAYKLLTEGRINEKGEPEAKFHEHDVDIVVNDDGRWTKTVTLKADKVGKILNFDVDLASRGLGFSTKYQSAEPGDCGYALPDGERCFEALYASLVMVCGAAAGDDFVLMPAAAVQKDSAAEVKKETATALYGQTFERIVGCAKADTTFVVDADGQVSDGSDASVSGAISAHIGKDWSAKRVERKFWKLSSGTQTRYIGIESGTKNGQPHFVVMVSQ